MLTMTKRNPNDVRNKNISASNEGKEQKLQETSKFFFLYLIQENHACVAAASSSSQSSIQSPNTTSSPFGSETTASFQTPDFLDTVDDNTIYRSSSMVYNNNGDIKTTTTTTTTATAAAAAAAAAAAVATATTTTSTINDNIGSKFSTSLNNENNGPITSVSG
ncbi:hypothetical protein BD408DRAFT_444893 [Parasitella parasitica]|nr:hypothetical protein BD408DRAFT_444893 [Parasitella parasitica]